MRARTITMVGWLYQVLSTRGAHSFPILHPWADAFRRGHFVGLFLVLKLDVLFIFTNTSIGVNVHNMFIVLTPY
jgi:hypothetical protein